MSVVRGQLHRTTDYGLSTDFRRLNQFAHPPWISSTMSRNSPGDTSESCFPSRSRCSWIFTAVSCIMPCVSCEPPARRKFGPRVIRLWLSSASNARPSRVERSLLRVGRRTFMVGNIVGSIENWLLAPTIPRAERLGGGFSAILGRGLG